ncbi:MAG: hypothetical protein HY458_01550 [Parcubacteria group bacterium]|nr:hypothetical protein [Parcubacteria group bacterium]
MTTGQFREFAGAVLRSLPDDLDPTTAQGWIENQESLRRILHESLVPPEAVSGFRVTERDFPVWKTLKLGIELKTADDFRRALRGASYRIGDWADALLGQPAFTAAAEETELDLVVVSVAELGFRNGAKRSDIYARVQELGLELCPAEVGPQLRLQYKDQPMGEWLLIGMEPIADSDSDGFLGVFGVARREDGLWLRGDDGDPDGFWGGVFRWVFVRRK